MSPYRVSWDSCLPTGGRSPFLAGSAPGGVWADDALLLMRGQGDMRPDHAVKHELFNAHIRDAYDVLLALDDRDRVVALWRSLGIVCLQVDEGNF